MKRNQWIRLAVFLISFAIFLMLPVHQYWMLEYTQGRVGRVQVEALPGNRMDCLDFRCVESTAPAGKGATDLSRGFVYFDLSGETMRIAGVAPNRKSVPENMPSKELRDIKLSPDGKNYIVPLVFHYYPADPAAAANLRMKLVQAKKIQLEVEFFPNGECPVNAVFVD